ncbi:MAG: tetratricopeptide repeat protein [Flavobacteriales bacterium]
MEDQIKVLYRGKKVTIPFSEKSDLSEEYQTLSKEFFQSKNEFILSYLEKLPIGNWSIESENLLDNIQINSSNVKQANNLAFRLENGNEFEGAIILLERIIHKSPDRVVAYLNLADAYWGIDNKEKAKENYKKYIELMINQGKDLKRIPQRVYDRSK